MLDPVPRTPHPQAATIQDVGVNHGSTYVPVTKQLLNRSDVMPVPEEMRRKGVSKGMAGRPLREPDPRDRFAHGTLDPGLMKVMTPPFPIPESR